MKQFTIETTFKVKGTLVIYAKNEVDALDMMYQTDDQVLINDSDIDWNEIEVYDTDLI